MTALAWGAGVVLLVLVAVIAIWLFLNSRGQ